MRLKRSEIDRIADKLARAYVMQVLKDHVKTADEKTIERVAKRLLMLVPDYGRPDKVS